MNQSIPPDEYGMMSLPAYETSELFSLVFTIAPAVFSAFVYFLLMFQVFTGSRMDDFTFKAKPYEN